MFINYPITTFISTLLIIIFLLLLSTILKIYPCGKDFISNLKSNFFHQDFTHLLSNLYGLYVISRIERKIGPKKFAILLASIILINTIIETSAHTIVDIPCSIGFSAILYGLFAWEISTSRDETDYYIISAIGLDIFSEIFNINKGKALVNHFFGIISGIILGRFLKF